MRKNVLFMCQVSYTFCCDFISLLMKSAGSSDEFGPTEVVVQGLKKVSDINIYRRSVETNHFCPPDSSISRIKRHELHFLCFLAQLTELIVGL